jgi:hypothetical protein
VYNFDPKLFYPIRILFKSIISKYLSLPLFNFFFFEKKIRLIYA